MSSSDLMRLRKTHTYSVQDLTEQLQKMEKDDLINVVIDIVKSNPPSKRKLSEIVCLRHATKDIPFFQKLIEEKGYEAQKQFCKNVIYCFFKKDEIVFNQGDITDRFYMILKGKVSVVVNHNDNILNSKGEMQQIVVTEEVNVVESGYAIGDVAVLKDQKRNAGIVCKEDTHFLALEKDDFNKIIADMEQREIQNKINFMQSLQLFEPYSRRQIELSMVYFVKLKVNKGQILCEEDKHTAYVYIIHNGEFRVRKSFLVQRQPHPFTKQQLSHKDSIQEMKENKIIKTIERERYVVKVELFQIITGLQIKNIFYNYKLVDALEDKPQMFTIECISQTAEVFQVKVSQFIKRIISECYDLLDYKRMFIQEKIIWRNVRLELIKKTVNGHSALLGGIYPKKNLINSHTDSQPQELVRRNTNQLVMYDRMQEKKQIMNQRYTYTSSQQKRSKSGDDRFYINISPKIIPTLSVQSISDISCLPDIQQRNKTQIEQYLQINNINSSTPASPKLLLNQRKTSLGGNPKIINIANIQLNTDNSKENNSAYSDSTINIHKQKNLNQKHDIRKKNTSLPLTEDVCKNMITNQINQYISQQNDTDGRKKQSSKDGKQKSGVRKEQGLSKQKCLLNGVNHYHMQLSINQQQLNTTTETTDQHFTNLHVHKRNSIIRSKKQTSNHLTNELFQNEKLKVICHSTESLENNPNNKIPNGEEVSQKNSNPKLKQKKSNKQLRQTTESISEEMKCVASYGNLLLNKSASNNTLNLQSKQNISINYLPQTKTEPNEFYFSSSPSPFHKPAQYKFQSDGLAQSPTQTESQYKELYKLNLIEDFNLQTDNYQQYYKRHYFKPGQNLIHHNNTRDTLKVNSQPTSPNSHVYFSRKKNKVDAFRDFDLMYSQVPGNPNQSNQSIIQSKNSSTIRSTHSSPFNQSNYRMTQNNGSEISGFLFKDLFDSIQQEVECYENKNDFIDEAISPTYDLDFIENVLKKKQEVCNEQQRKLFSHFHSYSIDSSSNIPASKEESQIISEQLARLLKSKFGKNQQQISTTDWRYNSNLNFNTDNDISNAAQSDNPRSFSINNSRKRKSIIALKQRFQQLHQKGSSTHSNSLFGINNQKQDIGMHPYGQDISEEETMEQIMDQILQHKNTKYISKLQLVSSHQQKSIDISNNKSNAFSDKQNNNFEDQPLSTVKIQPTKSQCQKKAKSNQSSLQLSPIKLQSINQNIERPATTLSKKQKVVIPLKSLTNWNSKQQEKQPNEEQANNQEINLELNQEIKNEINEADIKINDKLISNDLEIKHLIEEQSHYQSKSNSPQHQSDIILPSKDNLLDSSQLNSSKTHQTNSQVQQHSDYQGNYEKVIKSPQSNQNRCTFYLSKNQDNLSHNKVIQNKSFVPFAGRRQNNITINAKSPTRPKRVVNIKVKYDPTITILQLNSTYSHLNSQKNSKIQSPEKDKQKIQQKLSSEKVIPQLLIKQINKLDKNDNKLYKPLSQVEIWDSRMFTLPEDLNSTFYQYHTPLKNRKIKTFQKS